MLLVPALLIFTPADFFAVSPPTIGLDKDSKEKKRNWEAHWFQYSSLQIATCFLCYPSFKNQQFFKKCSDNGWK